MSAEAESSAAPVRPTAGGSAAAAQRGVRFRPGMEESLLESAGVSVVLQLCHQEQLMWTNQPMGFVLLM